MSRDPLDFLDDPAETRRTTARRSGGYSPPRPMPVYRTARHAGGQNPLNKYMDWAGVKSFIFQVALTGWTVLMGSLFLMGVFGMAGNQRHYGYTADQMGTSIIVLMFMLGGVWFVVALSLGIAAVAFFKGDKGQR